MRNVMTLGLVGLLGCNGNGSDSGRLEGSGFFFNEEGEPTSEQFYAIDVQMYGIINFDQGLQSNGALDYSELVGDGEYDWGNNTVIYDPNTMALTLIDGLDPWGEGFDLSVSPYSSSAIEGLYWNDTNPNCKNVEDPETGEEDLEVYQELILNFIDDCAESLLIYYNNNEFSMSYATPTLPSDSSISTVASEENCVLWNEKYCGVR